MKLKDWRSYESNNDQYPVGHKNGVLGLSWALGCTDLYGRILCAPLIITRRGHGASGARRHVVHFHSFGALLSTYHDKVSTPGRTLL